MKGKIERVFSGVAAVFYAYAAYVGASALWDGDPAIAIAVVFMGLYVVSHLLADAFGKPEYFNK